MTESRFSRQEALFGPAGQEAIEKCRVTIVGVGGLGSHVAQQLAYLGVKKFTLIDDDSVSESNLNRLIGASNGDCGRLKVEVVGEMIQRINGRSEITAVAGPLIAEESFAQVSQADAVLGCVDNDAARLILNELCQAYSRPYWDLATDINVDASTFGGRVLFADGRTCVHCKGLLDDGAVRSAFSSELQLEEQKETYGIRDEVLDGSGPAVVSLNGVIASLAVTEFMVFATGLRTPILYLEYRGSRGIVTRDGEETGEACYFCSRLRGSGRDADVERYVREGWAERMRRA